MYFWLNYCDKYHIERIPVAVKDIDHLFIMASQIIKADKLHLFFVYDGTRTDDNEYYGSPKVPLVWCKIFIILCKNFDV